MTDDRDAMTELELRRRFGAADPGTASLGLRAAVATVPDRFERSAPAGWARFALPAAGGAAAAVLAVLVSQGLGLLPVNSGAGAGSTSTAVTFDPTIVGPGLAAPSISFGQWLMVGVLSVVLFLYGIGVHGWRRVVLLGGMVVALGYATFCTFVPVDIGITGWGPGLNVVGGPTVFGSDEDIYYETAKPYEPWSFGLLLIGAPDLPVRVESVATDTPLNLPGGGTRFAAAWIDGEQNGGMTGPARRFSPFDITYRSQAIWIVGRASACALGAVPGQGQGGTSSTWDGSIRLNVTVLGWPRVVEVSAAGRPQLRIVEPGPGSCAPGPEPTYSITP